MFRLTSFWTLVILGASLLWGEPDKERLDILKYGLEGDIKTLLNTLRQEKNLDYNPHIAELYTRTTAVPILQSIVQYALETRWSEFKQTVLGQREKLEKMPLASKLSVITLVGEQKWTEAEEILSVWADGDEKPLALASLRTLGRLGTPSAGEKLLEKLRDPDLDSNFRSDLFWALGELKYAPAFEEIKAGLEDSGTPALLKKNLLEALRKLALPEGEPLIRTYLNDSNVVLRSEAVKSLSAYPSAEDLEQLYMEALRDGEAAVRIAAAQGLELVTFPGLKDVLEYRVRKDPEIKVREGAMKALLHQNETAGKAFLLGLVEEAKVDLGTWKTALNLALEWPETLGVLEKLVEREMNKIASPYVTEIANILGNRRQEGLGRIYTLLLGSRISSIKTVILRGVQLNNTVEAREAVKKAGEDPFLSAQAKKVLEVLNTTPPATASPETPVAAPPAVP